MIIHFLGTKGEAAEENDQHREHSSLLVEYQKHRLLIDWGESHKGEPIPKDIDAVLITHGHSDHSGAMEKLANKKVYMNKSTANILKDMPFKKAEVFGDEEIKTFEIGPFRVTAFPAMHSINYPASYYKITGDNSIVYCPDVLWIRKRTNLFKDVSIYIGGASATSMSVVKRRDKDVYGYASMLAQLKWCQIEDIKNVIFTHFGKESIEDGDTKTKELLKKKFSDGVTFKFAKDGMKLNTRTLETLDVSAWFLQTKDLEEAKKKVLDNPKLPVTSFYESSGMYFAMSGDTIFGHIYQDEDGDYWFSAIKSLPEKEILEAKDGIYLIPPNGQMIVEGKKKAMVKSMKYKAHQGKPLYLLSGAFCYGIIQYDEIREITLEQFKELFPSHRVTEAERLKWWKKRETLYYYPLKIIKLFKPPKPFKRPWGIQTFVDNVEFLEGIETLPGIDETENEFRARIQSPGKFDSDSFRRKPFPPATRGIFVIYACPRGKWTGGRCQVGMQIQALRFMKSAGWTRAKVRAWLTSHKFEVLGEG